MNPKMVLEPSAIVKRAKESAKQRNQTQLDSNCRWQPNRIALDLCNELEANLIALDR